LDIGNVRPNCIRKDEENFLGSTPTLRAKPPCLFESADPKGSGKFSGGSGNWELNLWEILWRFRDVGIQTYRASRIRVVVSK
jgi:hypothetical protein